ncbi:cell division protein FtsQ/DivIB [Actinomyces dentalis]|uniref:cell division protein FtsQ/DivIB n=1 Tax=Actinomyces dentalis TaxID=272548 RepID=UPI0003FF3929|nr:FtsQ-type POTRA domain-containing protein [Actinomyces dentalis]
MRKPNAPRPEVPVPSGEWNRPTRRAAGTPDEGAQAAPQGLEPRRSSADSPQTGALALFGRRDVEPAARQSGRGRDRVVSSGLTERLSERRRALRTLRLHRLGTALGLLGAAAVLVWAAAFSPLLALRSGDVTVTGSDGTVQAADVQRVVAAHEGISLVRLDPAAVGREVADSLVRVRTARVTRSWPHGVRVDLTMRRPIAVHEVEQGYEVLDSEAVVLETVPAPPSGLVMIAGQDGAEPDARAVSAVTGVVGSLDAETLARVARGSAGATGQVTLVLSDGARVRWGDASESALKARVLKVLLSQRASVYDVSSPHAPTTS